MKGVSAILVAVILVIAIVGILAAAWVYTSTLSFYATAVSSTTTTTYNGAFDVVGLAKASLTTPFGGEFTTINAAVVGTSSISGGNATLLYANHTSINAGTQFNLDLYLDITGPVQDLNLAYYNNYNETTAGVSGNFTATQIGLDSGSLYNYNAGTGTLASMKVGDFVVNANGATYDSGVLPAGSYVARFTFKMKTAANLPMCANGAGDIASLGYINGRLTSTTAPKSFSTFNVWVAPNTAC